MPEGGFSEQRRSSPSGFASGFLEQRRRSPFGFATVVALHAAVLGALVLIKGPPIVERSRPIDTYNVPPVVEPDPEPVPPRTDPQPRPRSSQLDNPIREIVIPTSGERTEPRLPPIPWDPGPIGDGVTDTPGVEPTLPPVRVDARLDPRYAGDLQPPYPPAEERAQRGGTVRLRVTIAASGRVSAVARLAATSDAFWRATERQALSRWRFRPATLDGRPVESSKTMTVHFRIEDI